MAGKVDPRTAARLAALAELGAKVQHVHGLVEQFAAARENGDHLAQPLKRAFRRLKMAFTGAGMDPLAQLAGGMEIAAGRGGSTSQKVRILREGVGSLKFQIDMEQRSLMTAARAAASESKE